MSVANKRFLIFVFLLKLTLNYCKAMLGIVGMHQAFRDAGIVNSDMREASLKGPNRVLNVFMQH